MGKLRSPDGVSYLMQHLQRELEPLEHMRVFSTLQFFFKNFRRNRGEEFVSFDLNFRAQMQKLDEIGAGLSGIIKSWWYLECAALGPELRKQVITASGASFQYERLREALMTLVPQVNKESDHPAAPPQQPAASKKFFSQKTTRVKQVNMVQGDDEEEELIPEEEQPEDEDEDPDEMERQAQVLMTQASKRRSQLEKTRGYSKTESRDQRESRIAEMKSRMCCSACKAHGVTAFGHWHSDLECPFHPQNVAKQKSTGKAVFVVSQDQDDHSDATDDAFCVHVSTSWQTFQADDDVDPVTLALSDTCCAKTVAGEKWMERFMKHLYDQEAHFWIVEESQAFRFGPGPKIHSTYAVVVPTTLGREGNEVHLLISVVPTEVPLLVSRQALQQLGAVLDLPQSMVEFKAVKNKQHLHLTSSGHMGFCIWEGDQPFRGDPDLWEQLDGYVDEVVIKMADSRTGFARKNMDTLEPRNRIHVECNPKDSPHTAHSAMHTACSSQCPTRQSVSSRVAQPPSEDRCRGLLKNDVILDTKDEDRVCGSHRGTNRRSSCGARETQCGSLEGDLGTGPSSQVPSGVAGGLEEDGPRELEEPVLRELSPLLCSSRRRSLGSMEAGSTGDRTGTMGSRPQGGHGGSERCPGSQSSSNLRGVQHPLHPSDQQGDEGTILRVHPLPGMQVDISTVDGRTRCQEAAAGAEGISTQQTSCREVSDVGRKWVRWAFSPREPVGDADRDRGHGDHQCESFGGGGGVDCKASQGQGGSGQAGGNPEVSARESGPDDAPRTPLLSDITG